MACIEVRDLSFAYPEQTAAAISHVSFTVEEGELLLLIGPSGGGKSTLLRALKPSLTPHGQRKGEILLDGKPISGLDGRAQAERIGFVLQNPENQIVTDKVWHELAFGMESLGYPNEVIRRRVAEMAAFFGIEKWFYQNTADLSGGQKQLLNLAAVMTLSPDILLLDEPTAQLDPIAASEFLSAVARLQRELGLTVILSEHRLEEALPLADRVLALNGTVRALGTAEAVGQTLLRTRDPLYASMPTPMRYCGAVTIPQARKQFLTESLRPLPERSFRSGGETVLELKDVRFRYEKDGQDVLRGLSCAFRRGQFTAILGGNGSGKSTTLSLLCGLRKPQRGKLKNCGFRVGLLPQDPQMLFVRNTVREDLLETLAGRDGREQRVAEVAALCRLETLLERHPYDLSGGEQQRAALAKILLSAPEVLLLDEPTKGMDVAFQREFAQILRRLLAGGSTVIMVSHDVEFCARYADRCLMMFDGGIVTSGDPTEFFSGNSFYTTAANRIARSREPKVVTCEELLAVCGRENSDFSADDDKAEPAAFVQSAPPEEKPLPLWRVLPALGCFALGALLLLQILTPLSILPWETGTQYAALAACLMAMLVLLSRKSDRAAIRERGRLTKRTWLTVAVAATVVPLTVAAGTALKANYLLTSLLVLAEIFLPFALLFEKRGPSARELVLLAVLSALSVAGRTAFYALPQFKPVMALVIISGVALGAEGGFLVGALSMLLSNILFGQGAWTPWQMFAMGLVGFLAGLLYRRGVLRRGRLALSIFGAVCAVCVYGVIMNVSSALTWITELNWAAVAAYLISGFPMDVVQGAATVCFLWLFAEPMLEKMDRIKTKYGIFCG